MTPKNDEEPVCSCQVKPYDIEDPSTWVRPKYVTLHDANAKCCRPPTYTVPIKPEEAVQTSGSVPKSNKHSGGNHNMSLALPENKPPVPVFTSARNTHSSTTGSKTIAPSTFYGASSSSTTKVTDNRPTLVNGKLVPSRMSAMETQTSKDKKVEKDAGSTTRDFMSEDKPATHKTYSRKDRKYRKWTVRSILPARFPTCY